MHMWIICVSKSEPASHGFDYLAVQYAFGGLVVLLPGYSCCDVGVAKL
jgi:hypothetical protein